MAETTSRILALLGLLQVHRQWSGPELAERLGVTERTLRRDIERLRDLGYRVEAERGSSGGYRLEAGTQLPPLLLSDEEAVAMAIGLRVTASQGLVDGEQTSLSALAKFEQVLPAALRERVNALASVVELAAPGSAAVATGLLGQVALACRDRERLRFAYTSGSGDETRRSVEPHSLVSAQRRWLLVAWDRERSDWRTFRVDRMSDFFGTRVHFAPRELPADDAAAFVARTISTLRELHSGEVVLKMTHDAMTRRFGQYGAEAWAEGETTVWPIRAATLEGLLSSLAWVPVDIEYELRGSPEFLALARSAAGNMLRAVDASRTQ
ncbi:transcriptional regulator [Glaciihabitans arcticus]|uniref:Transcriptional regulator n=1 Tax=Glaciihabitans arcticus TaxID=2668039 RepID=A0A4Q9GV75_9MICO|nr:transcriptional regulator [Glaciihabitans arcticus]TBN56523.1 transcriptional regulator [Glaciihabitans arcticus]